MNFPVFASLTAAASLAVAPEPLTGPIQSVAFAGTSSGFDAANTSTRRGYVWFPTLDTRDEVEPWSRLEMMRKGRYLTRNVGFAKRCTRGLAGMVGYLSPRALTSDREWNKKAEALFERRAGSANTFDRSAQFNFYSAQPMLTAARLTDGDVGVVLTSGSTGGAMCAFYEGHQIDNGDDAINSKGWRDGVKIEQDRAVAYRLVDPADTTVQVDIPASDFILHVDRQAFGHRRGVSALSHAINNMLDRTEIWSDVKLGIKLSNRIGYYLAKQQMTGTAPKGMGGKITTTTTGTAGEEVLTEKVFKGGKMMELDPGVEIKQLLDQRPHPNSREFLEDLNRDMAWGIGVSTDVLWNMAKLGGAAARLVLADAQVWIEAQQQMLVDQFLTRYWIFFVAKEMAAGRLPACADPDWWKVGWLPPAKLTVDIGRDGKLSIDLHRAGMLTLQRWYGSQGLEWEDEIEQKVREYATTLVICERVGKEFGITIDPAKVFPPPPGSSPQTAGQLVGPDGRPISSESAGEPAFGSEETAQKITDIHEWLRAAQPAA